MSSPRAILRPIAQLALVIAMAVALPAWLCRLTDVPDNLAAQEGTVSVFTPANEIRKLEKAKPDWVLIGNSMLNSRIDEHAMLSAASGWNARKVARGGSQSALWFLFLKNVVLEAKAKPALVTIFFRDTDLTWPDFRIKGVNEELIASLHGEEQPEWQQVLADSDEAGAGLQGKIREGLKDLYPAADLRVVARRQMQERAFRATRVGTKMNSSGRRVELNQRFSLEHLRHDLGSDFAASTATATQGQGGNGEVIDPGFYEDGPKLFDAAPEASFLPHMVQLAQQQGIKLHFHRVKRRPGSDHKRPDDAAMQAYMKDLQAWLAAHGCLFTDESQDVSLTLDMYADGDHIASEEAIQQRYLKNFWGRIKPVVQPALSSHQQAAN